MKTLIMDYSSFIEKYVPIKNKVEVDSAFDGCMYETYGDEFDAILKTNKKHVWTLVEEDGILFLIPSRKYVNRFGYFVTEKPWEHLHIQVVVEDD